MDAKMLYNQLLEEIHADELALDEKRELARLLKKRFDREPQTMPVSPSAVQAIPPLQQAPATAVAEAGVPGNFAQMVEASLPFLAGTEFVVGDVASSMRRQTPGLPEKINPKITTVLRRLYEDKRLVRTFKGGGNVPHKYRLVVATTEAIGKATTEAQMGILLAQEEGIAA